MNPKIQQPLEEEIRKVCENCDKNESSDCSMLYDFPTRCPKIVQVLLDYNLKANEYETGVRI